jgi:hypothetical protein
MTLPSSWRIHNVFQVKLLEPYRTSTLREAVDSAQVLRDYDNFIAKDYTFEEIIGSSYDTREKQVIYLLQWLDYLNCKDWIEEPFEHIMTGLEMLRQFDKSHPDMLPDPCLRDSECIYLFPMFVNA